MPESFQPRVATYEEWLLERNKLLEKEKAITRAQDEAANNRRQLPMVKVTEDYTFRDENARDIKLADLFGEHRQLIVYHMMMTEGENESCSACSFLLDSIGAELKHLEFKSTTFAVTSRGTPEKLKAYRQKQEWQFPLISAPEKFNLDYHATQDESKRPVFYNFKTGEELKSIGATWFMKGEQPGMSVFIKLKSGEVDGVDAGVYHTYSAYARGTDRLSGVYQLLDLTPLGRQDPGPGPSFPRKYEY